MTHWSMDKRAPDVLEKKKKKKKTKKKTATTTLKASSTRDTLETRHISVVRWRIRNALYALQIVQVERLSCNLCVGRDSYYRLPRNGMRLFCFLPVLRGCKP